MCAGNHQVADVLTMIWQLKYQWHSENGISVAHWGEISAMNKEVIEIMYPHIHIVDLCSTSEVLGMPLSTARYRLRGFSAKLLQ